LAWALPSLTMGFAQPDQRPDAQNENVRNRAIWYATVGFDRVYPSDSRVLWPDEVAVSAEHEEAWPVHGDCSVPRRVARTLPAYGTRAERQGAPGQAGSTIS
jgi:hypothetical protein